MVLGESELRISISQWNVKIQDCCVYRVELWAELKTLGRLCGKYKYLHFKLQDGIEKVMNIEFRK